MHEIVVLRVVVRLLLPFILMYALYILFHGELSPGGGFQAGVLFAAGFVVYSLVNDIGSLKKIVQLFIVRAVAAIGVLLYAGVGIASMLMGGRFLGYSVLSSVATDGQRLGIMLVETGIALSVFGVIMMVFYSFGERSGNDS